MLLFGGKELGRRIWVITNRAKIEFALCMSLLVLDLLIVLTPRPAFLPILIPEALLILLIFSPGSQAFYLLQIMRTFSFMSAWYFLGPWLEPLASNTGV